MDYGRPQGTGLWKYQWDLIHDPENVLFAWGQEEEEGAMIITNYDYSPNGYGGSEAIMNHMISNREEFVKFIVDFGITSLTPSDAAYILESYYDDVNILNDQEAYFYIESLLKYDRLYQLVKNKDNILPTVYGLTDESKILEIIRENIDTGSDLVIDLTSETLELVAHLRRIYNVTKDIPIEKLKVELIEDLNHRGKTTILLNMSNKQFKNFLRKNGITSNKDIKELIDLKNSRSTKFYSDSRITKIIGRLNKKHITQLLDNSSELGIVSVARNNENLTTPIFDRSIKLEKIGKTLESLGYAVDVAIAMKDIANGQSLEPADILFMIPGAPEMIEHMADKMAVENTIWKSELSWHIIKNWNMADNTGKTQQEKFQIPGHLLLQYTLHRGRANPNIYPTSFIILDANLASEIFGFTPDYVNYNNEQGLEENSFQPKAQSNKITW